MRPELARLSIDPTFFGLSTPARAEAATNCAVGVKGTTSEPKMRMATSIDTVGFAALVTGGVVVALAEGGGA